ncbi:MAG: GAF domain-containing protein [Candidatus Latescibacterota bacterium]
MKKTKSTSSELSFMLRMLQVFPELGSIEKIYRMLLAMATGGRSIGADRAMLFHVETEEGVVRGHIGVERKPSSEQEGEEITFESMSKEVFHAYERVDSSDLTLKLRSFNVPFGWHRSALIKAARGAYPVLAEGRVSEFSTDPFFEYFGTKSYLALPLKIGSQLKAVLAVDNSHSEKTIDADDISLLYSLSQHACKAIESLVSVTENEQKLRILLKLEQTLHSANKENGFEEALKISLVMIGRAVGGAGTFLKDVIHCKTIHVKPVERYSLEADEEDMAVAENFERILDKAASSMETVSGDSGHALIDEAVGDAMSHFFACPLSRTGDVIGAIGIYTDKTNRHKNGDAFSVNDKRFLELCAGLIALKLDSREKKERLVRQDLLLEEVRSNLARERDRAKIGEKGVEYQKKIEGDALRLRRVIGSRVPMSKRLALAKDILEEIEDHTVSYKSELSLPGSHFKVIDIFQLVERVVEKWRPEADELGLEVTVRIPHRGPKLLMDGEKIAIAIDNILKSITSVLKKQDRVLIECSMTKDNVRLVFADTGEGLPGDMLSRLFMPFVEVSSGDERQRALSLAGEILHTHAGEIKVQNSSSWTTILELSFSRMGNQDRRSSRRDRRNRQPDRRVPLKTK